MPIRFRLSRTIAGVSCLLSLVGCSSSDDQGSGTARVQIKNDFDNPEMAFNPPWAICESSYQGVEFGKINTGQSSAEQAVTPGLDYVLMVAAWADPECAPEHALPIASKNQEDVVDGQARTIAINLANHQGACPPEGVAPIPQAQYDRILERWPDFGFKPYEQRTENTECTGSGGSDQDAGTD